MNTVKPKLNPLLHRPEDEEAAPQGQRYLRGTTPSGAVPTPNGSPNPSRGRASSPPSLSLSLSSLLRGDEEALEEGDAESQDSKPAPPARRHYGPAAITRPPPRACARAGPEGSHGGGGGQWRCLEGAQRGWERGSWLHAAPHKNKIMCLKAVSECSLRSCRRGAVSTALGRLS